MTADIKINAITPRIRYVGDGITTTFSYLFPIFQNQDISVYIDDVLQTTNYSVNGAGNSNGGEVIFNTAPQKGQIITLLRNLEIKRTSDFQESGAFRAKAINYELDYQVACLQQLDEKINRSVIFPPHSQVQHSISLPIPQAGKALVWNDDASALCNSVENLGTLETKLLEATNTAVTAQKEITQLSSISADAAQCAQEASEIAVNAAKEAWGKISNVGDIFYTSRQDFELNGAVACNGNVYTTADFSGMHSIANLLSENKIPYISFEDYENTLSANGEVYAFGWDNANTFRVPTISPLKDSNNQIQYRAMVHLASGASEETLITATSCLQQLSNKVDKTSSVDREIVTSFLIPDYSAAISANSLSSGFVAPKNGILMAYIKEGTQAIKYTINGIEVLTGHSSGNVYSEAVFIPLNSGDIIKISVSNNYVESANFFPFKGAN